MMDLRFERAEKTRKSSALSVKVQMCTKGRKIDKQKVSITLVAYRFLFVCCIDIHLREHQTLLAKYDREDTLVVAEIHCLYKRNWP